MAERDHHLKLKDTPGGIITSSAFTYAIKFYDFAPGKHPELKQFPSDARGTFMQACIIVATLILLEKQTGGKGRKELHENVSLSFPPSARHRCLTAIQDLSAALLNIPRAGIAPEAIPSYQSLAAADDKTLAASIGSWLALAITQKRDFAESPLAATMGRSAWTSAVMIVRMLQKGK